MNAPSGGQLTFPAAATGLCGSFTVHPLESGAGFTFDDNEGAARWGFALSVGDTNNFEDDDFRLTFPTDSFHGVGFFLVDNIQRAVSVQKSAPLLRRR